MTKEPRLQKHIKLLLILYEKKSIPLKEAYKHGFNEKDVQALIDNKLIEI